MSVVHSVVSNGSSRGSSRTLYLRLQADIEAAITEGRLKAGSKLPAERQLAEELHISRTTVTSAYRELEAKGLVRGYVGRGTYVCALPEPANVPFAWRGKMSTASLRLSAVQSTSLNRTSVDPAIISFALGCPALECFPVEEYRRIEQSILAKFSTERLGLGALEGQPALRKAIASVHALRAKQVLVVAGSQQGLDLVARTLIDPGDYVIVEKPGYFIALQTFLAGGARLVGWDALRGDIDELEKLILRYHPKFICTTPTFQNPTSRTLSLDQRKDLIRLAVRYRIPLIEDDPYNTLYFDSPPPRSLRELDEHGVVIHLGTFSKILAPGLRVSYILAPENVVDLLALAKERASLFTAGLEQLILAEMLGVGLLSAHLERLRQEHQVRRNAMIDALRRAFPKNILNFTAPMGGLYVWCGLRRDLKAVEINRLAIANGVAFTPGELFYPDGAGVAQMRLCFTGSTVSRIVEGVRRLRVAVDSAIRSPQETSRGQESSEDDSLRVHPAR
jgi:DNA-binding transcriptional MocR family regulator